MRKISVVLLLLIVVAVALLAFSKPSKNNDDQSWVLEWVEDFDGDSLDTNVWGYMTRRKDDSRKYHSSDPRCYGFSDGKLIIKGIKNPETSIDTARYLTGAITTQGKKAFSHGRIEIKAKIGSATGAWPAFWLLPFKNELGWPDDGEIDIVEHLNYDDFVYQTIHSRYTKTERNSLPKRSTHPKINKDDFNVYGVEIFPDFVRFSVNGQETLTYPKVDSLLSKGQFPFNRDWYLMLDMQLGGAWVGVVDPDDLPVQMEIDWVKYYRLKE